MKGIWTRFGGWTPIGGVALCLALAQTAPGPAALAQSEQGGVVVPLGDPGRPATLEISLVSGNLRVTVHDRGEVVIVPRETEEERPRLDVERGLRRIPNTSVGLTAEERNNAVSVSVDRFNRDIELDITVPRRTSIRASLVNSDDLTVEGVTGEHELSNVNGDITAIDIAGSAVVDSRNGDVQVSFMEITPDKAMSFTTFNGDLEVMFPASLAADLRINAGRGEVLTDFDVEAQPQAPVIEESGDGGRYRVRLEREVRATVGGGGPEMFFKTFNGDIVIRRR